jgi:hypothetical protein
MARLPEKVHGAFQESLKLNLNLIIDDPDDCVGRLADDIRFSPGIKPDKEDVAEQIKEVFCKLFFGCDKINITQMEQGFSGAAVFQVMPSFQIKGQGEYVVVKIGNKSEVNAEKEKYEKYVKGIVGGHRIPEAIENSSTRHISGIQYSFVGLGGRTKNFASFYRSTKIENIYGVIENLYQDTLFPFKQKTGRLKSGYDLREFYMTHLHLDEQKFRKVSDRTVGGKHIFSKGANGEILLIDIPIVDPIQHVQRADFHANAFFTTVHGDLNGQNILLDQHHDAWLIDFATTTDDGHILQDYASLENNLRLRLITTEDMKLLFSWARLSLTKNLIEPIPPLEIQHNPDLLKAHQGIRHIRELASRTSHYSHRAYLMALFFNALRVTTFNDATVMVRDHAFYCASVIAERLSKGIIANA